MLQFLADRQPRNIFTGGWLEDVRGPSQQWDLFSPLAQITIGAIFTIGLFTLLYRENKFYRVIEHMFVGLAGGFSIYQISSETIYPLFWKPMVGHPATASHPAELAYWAWGIVLPLAALGFLVFSKKHSWMGRIPIGIIVGLWAGQQFNAFQNRYLPQLADMARPIIPNQMGLAEAGQAPGVLPIPFAINFLLILITFIVVLSYFIYSVEQKNKLLRTSATAGRWLLMVGFGVIFGTTMMTRFVLMIDRMYYLMVAWLRLGAPY